MNGSATSVEHRVPVRWADLDVMNHVNNVRFIELAEHSAAVLTRAGLWQAPPAPFSLQATYLAPVSRTGQSLTVQSRLEGQTLTQDILQDHESGALATCMQLIVTAAARPPSEGTSVGPWPFQCNLASRPADTANDGFFSVSGYFGYAQEARIQLFAELMDSPGTHDFVIAHVSLEVRAPLTWQAGPHTVRSRIVRLGRSSVQVEAEIGEAEVIARTVVVAYDAVSQEPQPLSTAQRAYFQRYYVSEGASWLTSRTS